jgi:tetratricopeptide (TPR) repeat protein
MKSKKKLLIISLSLGFFFIILIVVSLIGFKTQAQPKLISPVAKLAQEQQEQSTELQQSVSHYIIVSQEFLNQARSLANNNTNQTPEEKAEIVNKIEKALTVINQGIQAFPQDDRVYAQRASIHQSLTPFISEANQYAINDLLQASQFNSKNPDYYQRLANLYQQSGDFENAASAFFNAHRLSPADNQTLYDLALALEKSGQVDKAIRYYDKLIALLPADDQNLTTLKQQKTNLEKLLVNSGLDQLSEPGMEMIPQKPDQESQPILGTENLPLEQAVIIGQVIIASPEEENRASTEIGETSTNTKTGTGILSAGETEIIIYNQHVTNSKQIVIVPSSDTENKVLYLVSKKAGEWFKAGIDTSIETDISFNWWIVD